MQDKVEKGVVVCIDLIINRTAALRIGHRLCISVISQIQLVVYYQYCILIG